MKLQHPDSKATVDTANPEALLSQGWVEVPKPSKSDDDK